jgi:hypothetical protein
MIYAAELLETDYALVEAAVELDGTGAAAAEIVVAIRGRAASNSKGNNMRNISNNKGNNKVN